MSGLDAPALVGLLADDGRRRAFAALVLGAATLDDVATAAGLSGPEAAKAIGRLAEAGLVVTHDGTLVVLGAAFQLAAREALSRPASTEHADAPAQHRKVLNTFVVDGRLTAIPTSSSKRLAILDWLSQDFEPGRRYTEAMVNLIIGKHHAATAALRRYLVDHEYLARDAGVYWRIGGTTSA